MRGYSEPQLSSAASSTVNLFTNNVCVPRVSRCLLDHVDSPSKRLRVRGSKCSLAQLIQIVMFHNNCVANLCDSFVCTYNQCKIVAGLNRV